MASQLLTISMITKEALAVLENNLVLAKAVNRQYDNKFALDGAKVGTTVNLRKPPRYTVTSGPALQVQDSVETYVPLTLTNQDHVDIAFSTQDLTLNIDEFSKRFLNPAMAALANKVDFNVGQLYSKVFNMVGTPGTVPATAAAALAVRQRLNEEAAPMDQDRALIVNPASEAGVVGGLTNLFNPAGTISRQFSNGAMGDNTLGFNWAMSQNIPVHTYGTSTSAGNPTTNGAQAGGTTPNSDATTGFNLTVNAITGTITKGTVVTLSNVFAVNPQNRSSTGTLRQFVVTADVAASATTIPIYPVPIFSGQFQNVTSTTGNIASGATVTLPNATGSLAHAQNIGLHKDAFALATADLVMPGGVDMAGRENYKGISMRFVRQYDINTDRLIARLDVLYGVQAIYPELACRLTS